MGQIFKIDKQVKIPPVLDTATLHSIVTGIDGSVVYPSPDGIMLTDPFNNANPKVMPLTGSPALTTAGKFDFGLLSDSFFEPTTFIGAMGTTDWTTGWAVFGK